MTSKNTSQSATPQALYDTAITDASPRRRAALDAIFATGNAMLEEGAHITVVSVGERTQAMPGGPTSRTIYNTPDPYGKLVQSFVEAQSARKPGTGFAERTLGALPSLDEVIDSLSDPAHKAVLRSFEQDARKVRDRLRILEGFVAKVSAQDVARLTDSYMAERQHPRGRGDQPPVQHIPNQGNVSLPTQAGSTGLSSEDKQTIRAFINETLFDEGYEVHDGDVFHAQSGRSLRSEAFVALMQRLQQD